MIHSFKINLMKKLPLLFALILNGFLINDIHSMSCIEPSVEKNDEKESLATNNAAPEVPSYIDLVPLLNSSMTLSNITSGIYYSKNYTSNGTVGVGNDVKFVAGESILLNAGFTVEVGATFTGEIITCGGN